MGAPRKILYFSGWSLLGIVLGASWAVLGAYFALRGAGLGGSWAVFEACSALLGLSWGGAKGTSKASSGVYDGRAQKNIIFFWVVFFGVVLGASGAAWGASCAVWGPSWEGPKGSSQALSGPLRRAPPKTYSLFQGPPPREAVRGPEKGPKIMSQESQICLLHHLRFF